MYRTEEKLKYIDYNKNMDKVGESKGSENPTKSATSTVGFVPTNRNYNYQDVNTENGLLFATVNREKKEIIESEMPRLKTIEAFGSISSNEFESSASRDDTTTAFYDGSNDVMRGIMQEYNRVKDKGEFYTFKSTHRRKNVDLSSYMSPPQKTIGRGFGVPDNWEKTYLGEQTRNNDFRIMVKDSERIADVPYYLTALPAFKYLGGDDTRYLNFKLRG